MMSSWSSWPLFFFVAAMNFSLVLVAIFRGPKKPEIRYFALVAIFAALWNLSWGLFIFFSRIEFIRATFPPSMLIGPAFCLFSISFNRKKGLLLPSVLFFLPGIVLSALSFTTLVVKEVNEIFLFGYKGVAGDYQPLCRIYGFIFVIAALACLTKKFKSQQGVNRLRLKYFFIGISLFAFAGIIGNIILPLLGNVAFTGVAPLISVVWGILVFYAIVKHHLMDIRVAVTRAGVFLMVYSLVFIVPFLLGRDLTNTKLWYLPIGGAIFLGLAAPYIYRCLRQKAEEALHMKEKQYQRFVLSAARGLTREELLEQIIQVIAKTAKPAFAAVFLYEEDSGRYRLKACRPKQTLTPGSGFTPCHPLVKLLSQARTPLSHEEFIHLLADNKPSPLADTDLAVPFLSRDRLLGFMALGQKQDKSLYSETDINVFEILAQQSSLAIENCLYLEAFKKNKDRIAEAEKLAGLGGMAGGIAHQFKNRLNAFEQLRTRLVFLKEDLAGTPEDKPLDRKVVVKDLEWAVNYLRLEIDHSLQMINWLITYSRGRANETDFSRFPVRDPIDLALPLLAIKHGFSRKNPPFEFILDIPQEATIYAIKGKMHEIILNLIDNSYESITEMRTILHEQGEDKDYKPFIKISFQKNQTKYLITVSDNGVGIRDQDKPKIFMPFFTTKPSSVSGMGMGMYVVRQMITDWHKGRIWFESQYLKGASFFVELPKRGEGGIQR